jgi:transposase
MARPVIKFANAKSKQLRQLRELHKTHPLPSHRRRAHAMILSSQGYSPAEVADILEAHPDTVRRWIDHFNEQGCAGLVDQPRPGGEPMLDATEQETLRDLIDAFPNQPRQVISELKQQIGKTISRTTLRRYCHRLGLRWKRFRKSLKHRRDERKFRKAQRELKKLISNRDGELVFFDESALTLRGVVPYGWQPVGERRFVPVSGSSYPSLQTLGFQKSDETVRCYFHRGKVNSQTVIEVIDHFASHIRRPTTLVLDNASVHTSGKFNAQLDRWKERGLTIFRLPTYSPELNAIEGFWKKLKYQWMPTDAWDKFTDMLYCAIRCVEQRGIAYLMPSLQN